MKKLAIFGSDFNPPHLGHLFLVQQVQKLFNFDLIKVVPTGVNPFFPQNKLPVGRVSLVQQIFKNMPFVEVDDREVVAGRDLAGDVLNPVGGANSSGGISYTINTVNALAGEYPGARLSVLMGLDQWALFDKWKNHKTLIKKASLVILQRGNKEWREATPKSFQGLLRQDTGECHLLDQKGIKTFILKNQAKSPLKAQQVRGQPVKGQQGGRRLSQEIYFVPSSLLPSGGVDISSSKVRELAEKGLAFEHLVPKGAKQWVQQTYMDRGKKPTPPEWIREVIQVGQDKQGEKIKLFDLRGEDRFPFDWTMVVSGLNTRHTKALAYAFKKTLRERFNLLPQNTEGAGAGEWIALDYGDLVLHIFYDYIREHYRLEELWPRPL